MNEIQIKEPVLDVDSMEDPSKMSEGFEKSGSLKKVPEELSKMAEGFGKCWSLKKAPEDHIKLADSIKAVHANLRFRFWPENQF